jgi:Spy/CpxP family protein refolding chaperone
MKRILIHSTLALTLAASAAFAQQTTPAPAPADTQNSAQPQQHNGKSGRHHQFDAHNAAQHMSKKLGLTEDQTAKLEPILTDRQQKMQALHADTSLTQDQRREQAKSIMKDSQTQLATVLTPDQMQQLKSMHHGGPRGHRGGPQQTPDSTTPPSV